MFVTLVAAAVTALVAVVRYRQLRAAELAPVPADEKIRVPLWLEPARVRYPPRFRFVWDGPEPLAGLRATERLDAVVAGATDDEDRARRVMRWTRAQFEPGRPSPSPPPDAARTLAEIRAGRTGGFCAQYSFVYVQAMQSLGVPARCVTIREHEVTEVWLRDQQRWTMVDANLKLQVLDGDGRSLSAVEIQRALRAGDELEALAGNELDEPAEAYVARFAGFAVWLHNAFTSRPLNFTDFDRYRVWHAPAEALTALPVEAMRTGYPDELYLPPVWPSPRPRAPAPAPSSRP